MNTFLETLYEAAFAGVAMACVLSVGAFGVLTVMHHMPY